MLAGSRIYNVFLAMYTWQFFFSRGQYTKRTRPKVNKPIVNYYHHLPLFENAKSTLKSHYHFIAISLSNKMYLTRSRVTLPIMKVLQYSYSTDYRGRNPLISTLYRTVVNLHEEEIVFLPFFKNTILFNQFKDLISISSSSQSISY